MIKKIILTTFLSPLLACTVLAQIEEKAFAPIDGPRPKLSIETIEAIKKEIRTFHDHQFKLWNAHDWEGFVKYALWNSSEFVERKHGDLFHGYDAVVADYRENYADSVDLMGKVDVVTLDIDVIRPDFVQVYLKSMVTKPSNDVRILAGFARLRKFADGWKTVASDSSDAVMAQGNNMGAAKKGRIPSQNRPSPETIASVKKEVRRFYEEQTMLWNAHDLEGTIKHSFWDSPDYIDIDNGIVYKGANMELSTYRKAYADRPERMGHIDLVTVDVDVINLDYVQTYVRTIFRSPFQEARQIDGFEKLRKFSDGWKLVESGDSSSTRAEITEIYDKMMRQWNANDLSGYFDYYWDSENFVYIQDGVLYNGRKTSFEIYQNAFPDLRKMGTLDFDIAGMSLISPDTVSVFLRTTIQPTDRKVIPSYTFDILKKFSVGWKIVSHQDISTAPGD
jgi:hypothetical protein